jgi:hypothetical protein
MAPVATSVSPLSDLRDHRQLARLVLPGQQHLAEASRRPDHRHLTQQQQPQQQQLACAPPHLRQGPGRSLSASSPHPFGPSPSAQPSPSFLYQTPPQLEETVGWPPHAAAQRYPPIGGAHQLAFRPTSPLAPFAAPFQPTTAVGLPLRTGHLVGPYAAARAQSGAAHGSSAPFGRSRKPGTGHRPTDSIGPPPKAKLGGAGAVDHPATPVGPAVAKKIVVVKLPRSVPAAGEGEPLWVRPLPGSLGEGVEVVDSQQPDIFSKEAWPPKNSDRTDVERGATEVYLPGKVGRAACRRFLGDNR